MEFARTGIILNTENYTACVRFYRQVLGLPLMFALDRPGSTLTCLELGGAYLMIETGGRARTGGKTVDDTPVKLRFNVDDLDGAVGKLEQKGVEVERVDHSWGSVANFVDPDGNPCQLRSEWNFDEGS